MCDHCGCREYAPIAQLTADHVEILALAETLSSATRYHRPIDDAGKARLLELLGMHSAKEEAGLYPLLISQMGDDDGAFAHLEEEHREIAELIETDRFEHLAFYALQRHIEEEEEVLFSSALFWFDGDTWEVLEAVHELVDAESPGVAVQPLYPDRRPQGDHTHTHSHTHDHDHNHDGHGHTHEHSAVIT